MTRSSRQVQIVWGHKLPDVHRCTDHIIPWVHQSDAPYYEIYLRGNDIDAVLRRWLRRRSSEVSLRRARLLIADDRICGGYIALAGGELPGCRQADLLDLAREMGEYSYSDLRARMDELGNLFAPVEEHDFYLSKLGVLPEVEDGELSHCLMDDCLRRAQQGGFGRVRVDIPERDEENREFYEGYDFRPIYRGKTDSSDLRYLSMIRTVG